MPVTRLDPKTALVVIDLQEGIRMFAGSVPEGEKAAAEVFRLAGELTAAFRDRGLPVVLVNVAGAAPGRTEFPPRTLNFPPEALAFVPELNQQPSDIVLTKRTRGAFASTDIEKRLRDLGVTQIVICGIATASGVESTANQAYEAGFNVTLAIDAMMDMNPAAHAYSLAHIFPRIAETGTTADIIALVEALPEGGRK
jgi:nicotinamidase-related amidase